MRENQITSATDSWINYDQRGRLASEARTPAASGSQTYTTSYGYDAANRLLGVTYPSGRIVTFVRNAGGQVTSVLASPAASSPSQTVASNISYTPFGAVSGLTYGNGATLVRGYDTDGRVTSQQVFNAANTAIQNLTYAYDLEGKLTGVTDSVVSARTQQFGYSAAARLTSASGAYGRLTWSWDGVGNRATQAVTPVGGTTVSSTYARTSSTNRLASVSQGGSVVRQFSYDAAGNIVTDAQSGSSNGFTYDGAGQLVSFSQGGSLVASYGFDGLRRRSEVSKTSGGATTVSETIYSGGRRLAANDATGWVDFVDLGDLPLAVFDHGTLSYIHGDRLSTPIQATDGTGALVKDLVLDPFGQTVSATYGSGAPVGDTRRFPGQARDAESNLHQNFARTYDPTTGRYVSPDPIGLNGGANLYAYVGGNPTNFVDPSGHFLFLIPAAVGLFEYGVGYAAGDALFLGAVCIASGACSSPHQTPANLCPLPTSDALPANNNIAMSTPVGGDAGNSKNGGGGDGRSDDGNNAPVPPEPPRGGDLYQRH